MKPFLATITIKDTKKGIAVYFISKSLSSEKGYANSDFLSYPDKVQSVQEHLLGLIARLPMEDILRSSIEDILRRSNDTP